MSSLVPGPVLLAHARGVPVEGSPAATLFADISGFTELCERLTEAGGDEGAEALAAALRFYFDPLVAAVHDAAGFVVGFAGDAFTAVFPGPDGPQAAWEAASSMRRFVATHDRYGNPFGTFSFGLKVGLAHGGVAWGVVKAATRPLAFYVRGDGIDRCARAEGLAAAGEIVAHESLAGLLRGVGGDGGGSGVLGDAPASVSRREPPEAPPGPAPDAADFCTPEVLAVPEEGEFRAVTRVFVALAEDGELPSSMETVLERVHAYGGYLARFDFGDKGCNGLVLLGAPVAHEDDLDRGIALALDLRERLGATRFRAGVTVDVGYVVRNGARARHELTCLGRATNLAARLMARAPWGEVWCPSRVAGRAGGRFVTSPRDRMPFKGFAEPVGIHAIVGTRVAGRRARAGGLLERDAELHDLASAVARGLDGRGGGIAYVDGDAGLGKTALVEELPDRVGGSPAEVLCLVATCDRAVREAFNPFRPLLRSELGVPARASSAGAAFQAAWGELMEHAGARDAALARELGRLSSLVAALLGIAVEGSGGESLSPAARYEGLVLALRGWLLALSLRRPVILVVDDAHEMDDASREVLGLVARAAAGRSLALVCTGRPSESGVPWRLPGAGVASAVRLLPLTPRGLLRLVSRRLGRPVAEPLVAFLATRTGGNPFLVLQLLALLEAEERLVPTSAGMALREGQPVLPEDVTSMMVARLDRIPPAVRRVVQAAAVLGREVDPVLLQALVPEEGDLARELAAAEAAGIWMRRPEGGYVFRNALLRDAAYGMQARSRLRLLHLRAAEALEGTWAVADAGTLAALARHWQAAGVRDRARAAHLAAGRSALAVNHVPEGVASLSRYLGLVRRHDAESVSASQSLAETLMTFRSVEASREQFERTLRWARRLRLPLAVARARRGLGQVAFQEGRHRDARRLFRRAVAEMEAAGEARMAAYTRSRLAQVDRVLGRSRAADAALAASLATFRELRDGVGEATVLVNVAGLSMTRGDVEVAGEQFARALSLSREAGAMHVAAAALGNLVNVHQARGRMMEALEAGEEAYRISVDQGNRRQQAAILTMLGHVYHEMGDREQAMALLDRSLALEQEMGHRSQMAWTQAFRAQVLAAEGRVAEATADLDAARAAQREAGDLRGEAVALETLGAIHAEQGDLGEARACYASALDRHRRIEGRLGEAQCRVALAGIARREGRLDDASALLGAASAAMERIPDVLARLRLELERGRLDVARGRDGRSALDEVRRGSSGMKLGAMSPLGIEIAELARLVEGPPGRERPGGASA